MKKEKTEKVEPKMVSVDMKKPAFTKQPTLSVSVKPKDTATLIANIEGVPRPTGMCSGFHS